jgi:hypothetical protein
MRLGKWVRIFSNIVPVPIAFSASFGIREGGRLYLAPMVTGRRSGNDDAQIIITPIPPASWKSVCKLSVRLHDKPKALAKALRFLRERDISILLTEAAATFQERAHWDAVCDLTSYKGYANTNELPFEAYQAQMREIVSNLNADLKHWASSPENRDVFLTGTDMLADFPQLTGLNIAYHRINSINVFESEFNSGGVLLTDGLERELQRILRSRGLPVISTHALTTGSTEQRYMRLLFIRDSSSFMFADIECCLPKYSDGGIGMLEKVLCRLPDDLNILHITEYREARGDGQEVTGIKLIGDWPEHNKEDLGRMIESIEVDENDPTSRQQLVSLRDYATPSTAFPKVFISYSISHDEQRCRLLQNRLIENNYEPVLGTAYSESQDFAGQPVSEDVLTKSLNQIPSCIAFIALHSARPDFQLKDGRYTVPPWLVTEEVYAWSRNIGYLARLAEEGLDGPRYNRNTQTFVFSSETSSFDRAVTSLVRDLNNFRQSPKFLEAWKVARIAQYQRRTTAI